MRPYMPTAQIKITTINMKKMERKKRAYITPEIKVYPMENNSLLQTVSVTPNGSASGTSNWEADETHEGGIGIVEDGSNMAPAKKHNSLWDEEEEE